MLDIKAAFIEGKTVAEEKLLERPQMWAEYNKNRKKMTGARL